MYESLSVTRRELSRTAQGLAGKLRIENALSMFLEPHVIYTAPSGKQYVAYVLEDCGDEIRILSYRDNTNGVGYGWQRQWVTKEQITDVQS